MAPSFSEQPDPVDSPIEVGSLDGLYSGKSITVRLSTQIVTLIGPNGTGKTQVLKRLRDRLEDSSLLPEGRYVRFLPAGRSGPFESYRSRMQGRNFANSREAAVGQTSFRTNWWQIESLVGDYVALDQRPDLLLKVQARLQQLLSRSIKFSWVQNGLSAHFTSQEGDDYYSSEEASGILQLVPLLAAIYNEEIGALLIDEPEVSLHPQYQAFLLEELGRVAGDPRRDTTKKIVIIATHSPSMLKFNGIADLPSLVFFGGRGDVPKQLCASDDILKSRKLAALMARASVTHRTAIFAQNALLVEGPSDEIIATQLARRFNYPLAASNTQVVPVTGKGEFVEVTKLLQLMGKRVTILADLDALVDDNKLVSHFSQDSKIGTSIAASGHSSLITLDGQLRSEIASLVDSKWNKLEPAASASSYWRSCRADAQTDLAKRRATLSVLLGRGPNSFDVELQETLTALRLRYEALLNFLSLGGCFFLRRGAIEDYFNAVQNSTFLEKPAVAAEEAASFAAADRANLMSRYRDVLAPLDHAAPARKVDETVLLRSHLAGVVGSLLQTMTLNTSSNELNKAARRGSGELAQVFSFTNASKDGERRIGVDLLSPLFARTGFPFDVGERENMTMAIRGVLPSLG